MKIITVINAKGGCGKSTLAMNLAAAIADRGYPTLLIDMDPQAQLSQWLRAGDGLANKGTLVAAMTGESKFSDVIRMTGIDRLFFVASAIGLEDLGRRITDTEHYQTLLARLLAEEGVPAFDFCIIDSPNQISPIMENAIFPTDLFVVPFEGTQAVRSYANFYKLLLKLRANSEYKALHVLNRLSHQDGLRTAVIDAMKADGLEIARTEIRNDGWLARVSEFGGSIFRYRPYSNGAADMAALAQEVLELFSEAKPKSALIEPAVESPETTPTIS